VRPAGRPPERREAEAHRGPQHSGPPGPRAAGTTLFFIISC
jgi:hypothetical protein